MEINKPFKNSSDLEEPKPKKRAKRGPYTLTRKKWMHFQVPVDIRNKLMEIAGKKGMSIEEVGTWLLENAINKSKKAKLKH